MAVHCKITFKKPSYKRKEISYRNWKSVDKQTFITDIKESFLNNFEDISDVTEFTALYGNTLSSILKKHAPLRKRTVTMRPSSKWYAAEIKEAKSKRRRLERKWRSNKSEDNRKRYVDQCNTMNNLVYQTKMTFFCTLIQENTSNQAVLLVDKMLNRKAQNKLPSYNNASCLANKFADFFVEKIQTFKNNISTNLTPNECNPMLFDVPKTVTELHEFEYISKEELAPLLCRSVWKSCILDPIPGSVLKDCIEELLPIIARIVNFSLQSAVMPHDLKEAVLKPKIKKRFP